MAARLSIVVVLERCFPPYRRRRERQARSLAREALDCEAFAAMLPILEEVNAIVLRTDGPPPFTPRGEYREDADSHEATEFDEVLARLEEHVLAVRHPANGLIRDMLEHIILNPRYHNTYIVSVAISHVNDRIAGKKRRPV